MCCLKCATEIKLTLTSTAKHSGGGVMIYIKRLYIFQAYRIQFMSLKSIKIMTGQNAVFLQILNVRLYNKVTWFAKTHTHCFITGEQTQDCNASQSMVFLSL